MEGLSRGVKKGKTVNPIESNQTGVYGGLVRIGPVSLFFLTHFGGKTLLENIEFNVKNVCSFKCFMKKIHQDA